MLFVTGPYLQPEKTHQRLCHEFALCVAVGLLSPWECEGAGSMGWGKARVTWVPVLALGLGMLSGVIPCHSHLSPQQE